MTRTPSISTRGLLATLLLLSLLVAGLLSHYASSSPDGLERAAEDSGLATRAEDSPSSGGPLADYRTRGVDDDRLSGGLAGVVGAVAVLVLASGVVLLVRRRPAGRRRS